MEKTCPTCQKEFEKPYNESLKNWLNRHVFCSKECYVISMKGKDPFVGGQRNNVAWNKGLEGPRGENSASWKGGTYREERHTAMGRLEYKNWREFVFRNDNYTCQMCDQYGGCLHADHIKSWIDYPELRYLVSNGRTLCRACHYFITFKKKISAISKWGLTRASAQEA